MSASTTIKAPVSGGCIAARAVSAASTNETLVRGSSVKLFGWTLSNTSSASLFVRVYDKATAPAPATDTPILTLVLAAGQTTGWPPSAGSKDCYIALKNGLAWNATAGQGDTDQTATAAGDLEGAWFYA
jgi:hypothetical protein